MYIWVLGIDLRKLEVSPIILLGGVPSGVVAVRGMVILTPNPSPPSQGPNGESQDRTNTIQFLPWVLETDESLLEISPIILLGLVPAGVVAVTWILSMNHSYRVRKSVKSTGTNI